MTKSYRIGSLQEFKRWTMQVVRDPGLAKGMPKQWYDSKKTAKAARPKRTRRPPLSRSSADFPTPEGIVRLISDNLAVLRAIDRRSPASIRELASITKRSEPNVHRSLKKLESAGLVSFVAGPRRTRKPILTAQKVKLEIDLRA